MSSGRPGIAAAFTSLRIRDYRTLWWAGTLSFMAVQMQFLLRGVLAWDLTEREGALGLVYLCFGVALLISTPLGGVAADRLPKRRVLLVSQGALLAAAAGMGAVVVTDTVQFWMLLLAAITQGVAFGFLGPTRVAFTSELVGREQLGNAITLSILSMNGTRVFAPSLAGALAGIVFIGIGGAYIVAAVFSLGAFVMLLRCPPGSEPRTTSKAKPLAEIIDGLRYVSSRPHLRRLVLSSFVIIMFGFNYVAFIPALVKGEFGLGDGAVGLIMSASSIGAVAVAVPLASRADGAGVWRLMVGSGIVFGAGVIALGLSPVYLLGVGIVAVIGAGTTGYQSLSNTIALNMTDDSHQGRVQSLMMLSFAGFGIAAAPLGFVAEAIGLRQTIGLMGTVTLATVVGYALLERRVQVLIERGNKDEPVPADLDQAVP
ncbi:MAG TPA: MFS transporter [Ilumatobacteraceae bacterium]|nr:MFS transporter [Ilumatobacteraceae bacterium]